MSKIGHLESNKGIVYYIKAPFKTAGDFVKTEGTEGRPISFELDRLLVWRVESGFHAFRCMPEWGFPKKKEGVGQAIVDNKQGMVWADE